ncbi:MAG: FAD-dependent oxidoreductase, partial [Anaerolineae bacterium]
MRTQKDIIVIGGGIIGVCAATYLAGQGRQVTLIEKDEIGAGSSFGNAGLIANGFAIPLPAPGVPAQGLKWLFDSSSPFTIKPRLNFDLISWLWRFYRACNEAQMRRAIPVLLALGQGTLDLFDELLASETVDFGYERKGRLFLFTSEEHFEKWMADVALIREYGVEVSLLDADGVRRIEPNVLPAVTRGIYCDSYAHVNPGRFVQEMARLAQSRGVEIKTGTAVTGLETTGREVASVITSDGEFTPNQVVLAAGAWSPLLARSLK